MADLDVCSGSQYPVEAILQDGASEGCQDAARNKRNLQLVEVLVSQELD